MAEPQAHQNNFILQAVVFLETFFLVLLVVPSACFLFRVSDTLTREGSLFRSANYVLGAWNIAFTAGDLYMCQGISNVTAFKLLMYGLGLLITCTISQCFLQGRGIRKIANILSVWNFLVFVQIFMFSFVAFLPQMIVTPILPSVILFVRYLLVIISILIHYKFVQSYSYDPYCTMCLLNTAETASFLFLLYILIVLASLLEFVF